uniref:Uncharacterized protein n=1 Tax=Oryza nivara TaxID=4536 RepID=A0A0E0I793_ORYNI
MQSFMKFVDNLLLCRSPLPLDDLSISDTCNRSDDSIDYSDIHPWVRHALRSNARAFGIMEHSGTNLLSIDGYPLPFSFRGSGHAINVTMFSSTTLKRLVISSTETFEHFHRKFEHLVIDIGDLIPKRNIQLVDVSSVKKATVYLFGLSFQNFAVDCNSLSALSNVTWLELRCPSVYDDMLSKVVIRSLLRCETFSNLKLLKLGEWFLRDGCYPLLFLLHRSPNIENFACNLIRQDIIPHPFPHSYFCPRCGADDYEEYPNAAAAIDPPCKETEEIFLPKLKSSPFRFSMAVSKRFLLVPAINISGFANSRCIM